MVAIALAESSGFAGAHNETYPDNSYGLWQINMLDEPGYQLGEERRARYGLTSNDQLKDPLTNAKAALDVYKREGLNAWSVHSSGAADDFMPQSLQVAENSKPQNKNKPQATDNSEAVGSLQRSLQFFTDFIRGGKDDDLDIPKAKEFSAVQMVNDQEKDNQALLKDMILDRSKAIRKEEEMREQTQADLGKYAADSKKAAANMMTLAMDAFATPETII
jgi:PAB1-binding protein PBP1